MHQYYKSVPKSKSPLQPIPTGNPVQRIHIDIAGLLPRYCRGRSVQFYQGGRSYAIRGCYDLCQSARKNGFAVLVLTTASTVDKGETVYLGCLRRCVMCWRLKRLPTTWWVMDKLKTSTRILGIFGMQQ